MQNESVLSAARVRFEAARSLSSLPPEHRAHATHGHGFVATAYACPKDGEAGYPGGEAAVLQQRMLTCANQLTYRMLNEVIDQPDDESIARWIQRQLGANTTLIVLQSTPAQGVELDAEGRACVWRRYRFLAAHQLPNVPAGHKCGRMHGHGFEVIVHAGQNTADGQITYDDLDALWAPLEAQLHYRCLNDIEGLSNPTSEMLSSWLWSRLKPSLASLSWVTVYETASCGATFDGSQYRIWKDFTIDSAIKLDSAPEGDPRRAIHGDTYTLRLHLCAPLDQIMGWTVDFGEVKEIFTPVFKSLDHHPLFERQELGGGDTASLAQWILREVRHDIPQLARVDVFASDGSGSIAGNDVSGPALPV